VIDAADSIPCWPVLSRDNKSSSEDLPRISVVTPNFNYGSTLEATICSVLSQGYPNTEYIVIDGGSSDQSQDVIRRHERELDYWVSEPDGGHYEAVNKGFNQSTGDVLCWLNSDDVMLPWTLWTVSKIFSEFPNIRWLMGRPTVIQNGAIMRVGGLQPWPADLIRLGLFTGGDLGILQQESMFWRRSLWETAGPLREDLSLAADFELWTRFARHSELVSSSAVLGGFTIWPNNRSRALADKYASERELVVSQFSRQDKNKRAKLKRAIGNYQRVKNYTGIRGLVRRTLGIASLEAPVLTWDDRKSTHELSARKYFP